MHPLRITPRPIEAQSIGALPRFPLGVLCDDCLQELGHVAVAPFARQRRLAVGRPRPYVNKAVAALLRTFLPLRHGLTARAVSPRIALRASVREDTRLRMFCAPPVLLPSTLRRGYCRCVVHHGREHSR